MFDLISAIGGITSIANQVRSLYTGARDDKKAKVGITKQNAKEVLEITTELIEKFTDSVDLIFQTLAEENKEMNVRSSNMVKLTQANRRLYEISSEMQILVNSLTKRFPEIEAEQFEQLTNSTLQIVIVEDFISVELASRSQSNLLPIEPSLTAWAKIWRELDHANSLPLAAQWPGELAPTLDYFNNLLLKLRECKVELAKILQEIE